MISSPRELERLSKVEPEALALYLQRTGWSQRPSAFPKGVEWVRWSATAGEEFEILLPTDRATGDYVQRIAEALRNLSLFEARPWTEILSEVLSTDAVVTLARDRPSRGWREKLVSFVGLNVLGLIGLSRQAFEELFFTAVTLCILFLVDFALVSLVLYAVVGNVVAAVGLGWLWALGYAMLERQFILRSSRGSRASAHLRWVVSLGLSAMLWLFSAPVTATLVFRRPIEQQLRSQGLPNDSSFIDRFAALHSLLNESPTSISKNAFSAYQRRVFRQVYWVCLAVPGLLLLLQISMRFFLGNTLNSYLGQESKRDGPLAEHGHNQKRTDAPI